MEMLLDVTGPDSIDKISSIDEYGVTRQRLVELMLLHLLPPVFVDSAGRTPLVIAIALELWTTAHEIIRRSRDLSLADRTRLLDSDANGQSPLLMLVTLMRRWDAESGADVALGHCPEDVLLALLAAGAKVAPDDRGLEALWTVVLLRNSAVAQMLLDRLPLLINAPLPESLARDIFAGTSRLPLAVPQRELLAPALYAVVVDAEDEVVVARVVKQMLQKGARPIDLLDCAIASKDSPTLRALAVECARRDGEESDPTSTARFAKALRGLMDSAISDSNCEELLVAILGVPAEHNVSFYADTASSAADISPLAAAVQRSNLRACRALLRHRCVSEAIDARDVMGWSALHHACALRSTNAAPIVELLLKHGANPRLQTRQRLTPLLLVVRHACRTDSDSIVAALLKAGADPDHADPSGLTPLMIASERLGSDNACFKTLSEGDDNVRAKRRRTEEGPVPMHGGRPQPDGGHFAATDGAQGPEFASTGSRVVGGNGVDQPKPGADPTRAALGRIETAASRRHFGSIAQEMQTNAASVDVQVAGVRAIWGLLWRDNAAWKDTQRVFASVAEQGVLAALLAALEAHVGHAVLVRGVFSALELLSRASEVSSGLLDRSLNPFPSMARHSQDPVLLHMGLKLWDALYEGTGLEIESWNAHQVSPEHCGLGETECKQPSFSSMDTTIWLLVFDFAVHASALSESSVCFCK
mmetsp:Transcript_97690/g.146423  ORF Transcript_97690/g.146423 Transcript_97690/m.146423 type:complete len:703 (-) Transcript_97690:844-2952(-)